MRDEYNALIGARLGDPDGGVTHWPLDERRPSFGLRRCREVQKVLELDNVLLGDDGGKL